MHRTPRLLESVPGGGPADVMDQIDYCIKRRTLFGYLRIKMPATFAKATRIPV